MSFFRIFKNKPKRYLLFIAISCFFFAVVIPSDTKAPDNYFTYQTSETYPLPLNLAPREIAVAPSGQALQWQKHTIASGESLAVVFQQLGFSARTLHQLINSDDEAKSLTQLRPGVELEFGRDELGQLQQLRQRKSNTKTLIIERISDNAFSSRLHVKDVDYQTNYAQASITSSFWNAGIGAGLTPNQVMELATLFGWDIDFALDIRAGDHFKVLFEERWSEGQYMGHGKILAAEFTNFGQTFTAILAENGEYYDAQGLAMKKAFLRSPVNFRYVSSNFNPKRLHPVTGRVRAHNGTDYVAPVGTPIWAAGNGVVTESSYNQYNGNYVFIRHNATYTTKYLHLTKRTVRTGQRVKQGETIGTLGATGRVTGAHLHYEFLVNGKHKNPRTVDLPQAESLLGDEKTVFLRHAQNQVAQMMHFDDLVANHYLLIDSERP